MESVPFLGYAGRAFGAVQQGKTRLVDWWFVAAKIAVPRSSSGDRAPSESVMRHTPAAA
jgi:hypothetical protein